MKSLILAVLLLVGGPVSAQVETTNSSAMVILVKVCGTGILGIIDDGNVVRIGPPEQFGVGGKDHSLLLEALKIAPEQQRLYIEIEKALEMKAGITCPTAI